MSYRRRFSPAAVRHGRRADLAALRASLPVTWALLYQGNIWLRCVSWTAVVLRLFFGAAAGTLMLIAGGTGLC